MTRGQGMRTSSGKTYEEQPDGSFIEVTEEYQDVTLNWPAERRAVAEGLGYKVPRETLGGIIDEQA